MPPYTPLHLDDVTILFLDYDVIIFDDVNPYGIATSLCPWRRTLLLPLLTPICDIKIWQSFSALCFDIFSDFI